MKRKIGEEFEYEGVKLKVVEAHNYCESCYFDGTRECCSDKFTATVIGECMPMQRDDYEEVIFEKVE